MPKLVNLFIITGVLWTLYQCVMASQYGIPKTLYGKLLEDWAKQQDWNGQVIGSDSKSFRISSTRVV